MKHVFVYAKNPCATRDCLEGNLRVHSETLDYLGRQPACVATIFSKKMTSNKYLNMKNYKSKAKKNEHTQNRKEAKAGKET